MSNALEWLTFNNTFKISILIFNACKFVLQFLKYESYFMYEIYKHIKNI